MYYIPIFPGPASDSGLARRRRPYPPPSPPLLLSSIIQASPLSRFPLALLIEQFAEGSTQDNQRFHHSHSAFLIHDCARINTLWQKLTWRNECAFFYCENFESLYRIRVSIIFVTAIKRKAPQEGNNNEKYDISVILKEISRFSLITCCNILNY